MAPRIDPAPYLRFPKLDVTGAIGLAKILLRRTPKRTSPQVRRAAALVEAAVVELKAKWKQQSAPLVAKRDARPLIRHLGSAWRAIRSRLVAYEAAPEGSEERMRARAIHDLLFPDGLAFTQVSFTRQHTQSEHRIEFIDERGLAKDLAALVGDYFVALLRAAHLALGDALGITKARAPAVPVLLTEPLRALADAIGDYALQLLAVARDNPQTCDEVVFALSPILESRASVGRRNAADDEREVAEDAGAANSRDVVSTPLASVA